MHPRPIADTIGPFAPSCRVIIPSSYRAGSPRRTADGALLTCYVYSSNVTELTYGEDDAAAADPARAADHGHPLPARARDGGRGAGGPAGPAARFDRPHAAARARGQGARAARRGRAPLRFHAGHAASRR